jgi:hypothetical protein
MRPIIQVDRRARGVFLFGVLVCGLLATVSVPVRADEKPTEGGFSGLVLDPAGKPASGFRLVFLGDDQVEHTSSPSDELGRYSISVPAGLHYRVVAALAPDGTRLDVPELPPLEAEVGVRRLDIRIRYPEEGVAGATPSRTWQLPWVRVGVAAGATLLLWSAVWNDNEHHASPYLPPSP